MKPSALILEPGTVLAGKLRIIRLIGEGGMGAVYEVEHEFTKHRRALKLLHPEMALVSGVVARFQREASAAGRIGNPHIVETFDAGMLETGEPYIVMELVEGRPLGEIIAKHGRLDFTQSIEILRQACEAIQAAHDAGIVHRDLKPENLMLLAGDRTFVKILDFGISKFDPARTRDNKLTQDGATLGTPYYMSPEQVRGQSDLDGRTDVYALGVVLYECLTGRKPFAAETLPAIAVLIHEGKYQPLRAARPEAPAELETVVARAISVDREARYPTPAAFAEALAAIDLSAAGRAAGRLVAPPTEADGTPIGVLSTRPALLANPSAAVAPEAIDSPAVPAGTDAGVASDAQSERRHFPKLAGWLAAAALLVGLGFVWMQKSGAPTGPAARAEDESGAPASETPAPTVIVAPAQPPNVVPELSAPKLAPSALPSAMASAVRPERRLPGRAAPAAPSTPAAPSRANQHGLAEDNPFQ